MKTTLTRNERIIEIILRVIVGIVAGVATTVTMIIFSPFILWKAVAGLVQRYGDLAIRIILLLIVFASFIFLMMVAPEISYKP